MPRLQDLTQTVAWVANLHAGLEADWDIDRLSLAAQQAGAGGQGGENGGDFFLR